jgi:amidase
LKGVADLPTFLEALGERELMLRQWNEFMETWPVIVMPSCSEVALPAGIDVQDVAGAARTLDALRFQLVLPVLGLPGLAVPTTPNDGHPLGVQVVSRRYREDICLDAGEVIEAHLGRFTPIDPRS